MIIINRLTPFPYQIAFLMSTAKRGAVKQLAKSKILRKAERIAFSRNSLDCEFDQNSIRLPYILKNTNFKNLRHLNLSKLARFNGIFEAMSKNNTLRNLESLDLSHKIDSINHANSTWPSAIKYLANANLDKLKSLDMSRDLGGNTTDAVFAALSGSKWFANLERLVISEMSISGKSVDLLSQMKWSGLKYLDMSSVATTLPSLEKLITSSMVGGVDFLDLSDVSFGLLPDDNTSLAQCEELLTNHLESRSVSCKSPVMKTPALTGVCVFQCND